MPERPATEGQEHMTVRKWNPDGMAAPVGAYSHVSVPPEGARLVFVSGQVGAAPDGTIVAGCAAQTTQTFANLERVLDELGATPAHVVKLFTMLVGEGAFAEFAAARTAVFDRWYPDGRFPAHSAAIVAGLATPEILVEIEAVVAVSGWA
ncbi:RidA family protein [Pseudonocardia zijingensis]|uniref:RidA family protein n=2 Tax=Pseudonocardia zijingensis TaxID=153376 RepID=A0ABP3YNP4_9PSEU